jgi:hypothetical protein
MRNPAHDPVKGDVLLKARRDKNGVLVQTARRVVLNGKAGTPPYYVTFMNKSGPDSSVTLPSWRKWAKDAMVEHMAAQE